MSGRFVTVGAIWENDTNKNGEKMYDDDGNEITLFRMKIGGISYRLFQKESNDSKSPIFDVCFDVEANSYKKKDS